MLTIDALKGFGANTDEGMARCLNKEAFYLRLVKTVPTESNFQKLRDSIAAGDLNGAFEAAHSLKGILSNLSLTPISVPVGEMTEKLRARTEMDYSDMLAEVEKQRAALEAICAE